MLIRKEECILGQLDTVVRNSKLFFVIFGELEVVMCGRRLAPLSFAHVANILLNSALEKNLVRDYLVTGCYR